jgi:hypothetical protein
MMGGFLIYGTLKHIHNHMAHRHQQHVEKQRSIQCTAVGIEQLSKVEWNIVCRINQCSKALLLQCNFTFISSLIKTNIEKAFFCQRKITKMNKAVIW